MKNTGDNDDFDFSWAINFSKRMTKFGEKMAKLGEKMADMDYNSTSIFNTSCTINGDTQMFTKNGKTTIKKGNIKIVIDKDGNVTVNGKKVEKEEEKKTKHSDLEKLTNDSDLFRNIVPTKVCVDKNLTTPLTLSHLDKYELELTKLESNLVGKIEKLFIAVAAIGMMSLATLISFCINS